MATSEQQKIKETMVKTPEGAELQMEDEQGRKMAVGFSMDQVMMMIREMRKPDDETLRQRAEKEARDQESMRQMIALYTLEEETKKAKWANCNHKMERGESAMRGQVFSNGCYQAICLHCQMLGPKRPITPEMMAGMSI